GSGSAVGSGSDMGGAGLQAQPAVAWRTLAMPDGRFLVTHQRQVDTQLHTTPGGYGQGCNGGPVESAITIISADGTAFPVAPFIKGALPVDAAIDPSGTKVAVAMAGKQSVQVVQVAP